MLELKNINKDFSTFALKNISFSVEKGEYFVLLGRSGSGKSVILELIAGLIDLDSGVILLDNKDISAEKIQNRQIGLVFQDQAIFPHMTVRDNIAYPLQGISKSQVIARTDDIAEEMNLTPLLSRKANNLSGGEKQRVALARILALNPKCLLLDEPFASLDVQLKHGNKNLLRRINKKGITIVHVTHDYEEAIALADKVAVIHNGEILQLGTPDEVFKNPKSDFVANFVGVKNFFRAKITKANKDHERTGVINDKLSFRLLSNQEAGNGFVLIRGKNIILSDTQFDSSALNTFKAKINDIHKSAQGYEIIADIGVLLSIMITQHSFNRFELFEGKDIWVSFKGSSIRFLKD